MHASSLMPGHLIRRLHQHSTQIFLQRMRAAGIDLTPVQFAALDALSHNPGTDQARLADAIAKDRATVGSVVDRLEQKGLIARDINSRDKRARKLSLTPVGQALLTASIPVVADLQKEILPGLSAAEYETFVELARKATNMADIS